MQDNNKIRQKALSGFIWTATKNVGVEFTSFIVFLVLARLLGPDEFGLVAIAMVFIGFVTLFTGASLTAALVQRPDLEPEHLDSMFWLNAAMGVAVFFVGYLTSGHVANFFGEPLVEPVIDVLLVSIILNSLSPVQISILRRQLRFKSIAVRTLVSEPIAGIVGITMAISGMGVWSLVARTMVSAVIRVIILWRASDWRPTMRFSVSHLKELMGFGLNVTASNFLSFATKQLDHFLIGAALGVTSLGYYSVAKRLIHLMSKLVGGTIEHVAWPIFSRMQHDRQKVRIAFYRANEYASLAAFPIFAGLALVAVTLIPAVFGEQWAVSATIMQMLAIVGLFDTLARLHEALIVGLGRPSVKLRLQLLLSVVNLIVFLIVFREGLFAIASAYAVVAILLAPAWVYAVKAIAEIDLRKYVQSYSAAGSGAAIMTMTVLIIDKFIVIESSAGSLALLIGAGAISYLGTVLALRPKIFCEFRGGMRGK